MYSFAPAYPINSSVRLPDQWPPSRLVAGAAQGGSMVVNDDGTVTVFGADGSPVYVVDAPWAYDADGNPVTTDYIVRDGMLIQRVFAPADVAYPILADPPGKKAEKNGEGPSQRDALSKFG